MLKILQAACLTMAFVATAALPTHSQEADASQETAAADTSQDADATPAAELLDEDELEVLVARIALYPDELIALISGASLYPLQIVEAERFLEKYEADDSIEPKESWDGSVISLLNYPEILHMMSEDLDWTQAYADALAYQQKDVLIAIQQLREEAVADGIIKSDDKVEVAEEDDNIIIKPASPEVIYVPQYDPQILYVENYPPAPVAYYPTPYTPYYLPGATFFAGAVTGAIWAAAVDWNDWGVWGGRWNGNNIDIDCNNCFNNRNFNGKVNINDIDWKNVDRSKIKIDRNQFTNIDRTKIRNNVKADRSNSIGNKAANIKKQRPATMPGRTGSSRDVRKSVNQGLKDRNLSSRRPASAPKRPAQKPAVNRPAKKPAASRPKPGNRPAARPPSAKKPGARVDNRPRKPSALGDVNRGKRANVSSQRGSRAMNGGARPRKEVSRHKSVNRSGARRRR